MEIKGMIQLERTGLKSFLEKTMKQGQCRWPGPGLKPENMVLEGI